MASRWQVMSEYCREQHPLLCEEAPEEELYSHQFYRRIPPKNCKGRVRNNLKGAAAVLTRWPDHWSSFLTYLWIGIGMISLSTFIIYNSLFTFSLLPSVNLKPTNAITVNENKIFPIKRVPLPDVYMHIFVNNENEDILFEQFMPYLEIIASTFLEYKFNFIVVANDTNAGWISAEENNELALNTLWKKDINSLPKETRYENVNIEYVTISTLFDKSPLKKYWRILPHQLIEFLARTVSIWEKGGVAFNPDILTPKFQHTLYIEKLQNVLNKYANTNRYINISKIITQVNTIKTQKKYKKINNIRDIIDALERENFVTNTFSEHSLDEAENRDIKISQHDDCNNAEIENKNSASETKTKSLNKNLHKKIRSTVAIPSHIVENMQFNSSSSVEPSSGSVGISSNITKLSLLPLLFEFFFHNNAFIKPKPLEVSIPNRTRKSADLISDSEENLSLLNNNLMQKDEIKTSYKPVILTMAEKMTDIYTEPEINNVINTPSSKKVTDHLEANRLTIDLKGNIIGTATSCHAFLGTIFSNVIHHSAEETITDFIIAELTIFCKGLLSTCTGIDLILL